MCKVACAQVFRSPLNSGMQLGGIPLPGGAAVEQHVLLSPLYFSSGTHTRACVRLFHTQRPEEIPKRAIRPKRQTIVRLASYRKCRFGQEPCVGVLG